MFYYLFWVYYYQRKHFSGVEKIMSFDGLFISCWEIFYFDYYFTSKGAVKIISVIMNEKFNWLDLSIFKDKYYDLTSAANVLLI